MIGRAMDAERPVQADLFGSAPAEPEGLAYRPALVTLGEAKALAAHIAAMPLQPFEFHGHLGHRRTASFGWRYDYDRRRAEPTGPIPEVLLPLRAKVAGWLGRAAEDFVQALAIEYAPGAGIGWHRDKPQFGLVAGVSLLAPCVLRFRRREGERWGRASARLEPGSAYALDGPARWRWEHSITPMAELRYSITFRTLAEPTHGQGRQAGGKD